MWSKWLLLLVFMVFGCAKKEHNVAIYLHLEASKNTETQLFYSDNFLSQFNEDQSTHFFVEANKPTKAIFKINSFKKIKRLRIDFNTDEEFTVVIDSMSIIYQGKRHDLKPEQFKDWLIPNEQIKLSFSQEKIILNTFKTDGIYDPYLITKNLQKYLD